MNKLHKVNETIGNEKGCQPVEELICQRKGALVEMMYVELIVKDVSYCQEVNASDINIFKNKGTYKLRQRHHNSWVRLEAIILDPLDLKKYELFTNKFKK